MAFHTYCNKCDKSLLGNSERLGDRLSCILNGEKERSKKGKPTVISY